MKQTFFLPLLPLFSVASVLILGCNPSPTATPTSPIVPSSVESPIESPIAKTTENSEAQGTEETGEQRSGTFVDGEHPTTGTASLVEQDGKPMLELDEGFETSTSGPDLFVVLHRAPDVIGSTVPPAYPLKEGDYVIVAPLEAYSGAQRYEIPADVNLNEFESVVIWCRRFNATFGAARLQ